MATTAKIDTGSENAYSTGTDASVGGSDLSPVVGVEPRVVAVIPAYNEEIAIGSVVLGALFHVDKVIVVDDCSRDRTAKLAEMAGA
jgi:cellulose synthase/poly-beta-1,6-N-acetylglucosamine synthase-like glycosyltransferase